VPGVALALYLLFLAVAFGWRSYVQYRRTGDLGFRGFARGADPLERVVGALFSAALVALALVPLGALLGLVAPLVALDVPVVHGIGLLLASLGFAVTVLAQLQMGDSWRIGVDASEVTPLVRRGVFAHVRNPIFSGMLLAALGLGLLVPTGLAAAAWLALLVAVQLQVRRVEEPYLLRTHGGGYREYARAVGRFLPGVGRLRAAGASDT
jgi:protein-S-isoprenylcysteine O-methyltransferase Ste14